MVALCLSSAPADAAFFDGTVLAVRQAGDTLNDSIRLLIAALGLSLVMIAPVAAQQGRGHRHGHHRGHVEVRVAPPHVRHRRARVVVHAPAPPSVVIVAPRPPIVVVHP